MDENVSSDGQTRDKFLNKKKANDWKEQQEYASTRTYTQCSIERTRINRKYQKSQSTFLEVLCKILAKASLNRL